MVLAESRGIVLTQARLEIYLGELSDLPLERVIEAIRNCLRNGSPYFPQIPELRAMVNPQSTGDAAAEHAWQETETWVRRYYHPDRGLQGSWNRATRTFDPVPPLDSRSGRALRAIGGPNAIWSCADYGEGIADNYPFVRKEFLRVWKLAPEVERIDHELSAAATKMLPGFGALAMAKKM